MPWVIASENRRKIHVGNLTFSDDDKVLDALGDDIMQSIVGKLVAIANNNYKLLIYNVLLHVINAPSIAMNWIDKFQWQYAKEFRDAERKIWKIKDDDKEVAGYIKQAHSFLVA